MPPWLTGGKSTPEAGRREEEEEEWSTAETYDLGITSVLSIV